MRNPRQVLDFLTPPSNISNDSVIKLQNFGWSLPSSNHDDKIQKSQIATLFSSVSKISNKILSLVQVIGKPKLFSNCSLEHQTSRYFLREPSSRR